MQPLLWNTTTATAGCGVEIVPAIASYLRFSCQRLLGAKVYRNATGTFHHTYAPHMGLHGRGNGSCGQRAQLAEGIMPAGWPS